MQKRWSRQVIISLLLLIKLETESEVSVLNNGVPSSRDHLQLSCFITQLVRISVVHLMRHNQLRATLAASCHTVACRTLGFLLDLLIKTYAVSITFLSHGIVQ